MPVLPVSQRGYVNPELLVESDWLAEQLDDPELRIIDTRSAEAYAAGHLPGAINLAAFGSIPRQPNGDMGDPETFERLAGNMGISNDSTVIIHDAPSAAMGMAAWAFSYFGHESVKVLDGGYAKWTREGRGVSLSAGSYPLAEFHASLDEDIYCPLDHAKAVQGRAGTVFWDVRTTGEYQGTEARNNARAGRVPGAVHLEWTELLDSESGTFKPADDLRLLLKSRGITPESEINCY